MSDKMGGVLITGGAGFIGSHLVDRLLSQGNFVRVVDNFDSYYNPKIKRNNISHHLHDQNFELIEGDIRDTQLMKKSVQDIDVIIHEAAQAGVPISVRDPTKTIDVNVNGTVNVLVAARDAGIKKVVFASSSSVYGKVYYLPFDEKHPTEPVSPYGASKLACEHLCRVFSELYGMVIPQLRYFTVYGPRMRPDLAISIFMQRATKNEDIIIYGDGSKSRDFTYIDDVVDATLSAVEKGKTDVYNIGGGNHITIKNLVEKIIKITGSHSKIIFSKNQKGDVEHTMADNTKARKYLGWGVKGDLDRCLVIYYNFLLKQNL